MSQSNKYIIVKRYWDVQMWTEKQLRNAVLKEWITAEEFVEITGLSYEKNEENNV